MLSPRAPREAGFALIASISIMAVLVMISVTLYSLSNVATQSAAVSTARNEAEANAKMALMQAMGKLQSQLGPDQRISANASILDSNPNTKDADGVKNPHWLGVWDSWIAGDPGLASVNPNYPSAASHHQTLGQEDDDTMRPEYNRKDQHFREWLISLDSGQQQNHTTAQQLELNGDDLPAAQSTAVRLVGSGSLGSKASTDEFVNAGLIEIKQSDDIPSGRYAWWVGDQSQKAALIADSYETENNLTGADLIFRSNAPGSMGTTAVPGLENLNDETQIGKLTNLKNLDLLDGSSQEDSSSPALSEQNFHNVTLSSFGVLADVREGGLKRDLSTLLERPIDIDEDSDAFMLYAFDDSRFSDRSNSRVPIQDLAAYYQLYKDDPNWKEDGRGGVNYNSPALGNSLQVEVPEYDGGSGDVDNLIREYSGMYRQPAIIKVQFLLAVGAQEITDADRKDVIDQQKENKRRENNMDYTDTPGQPDPVPAEMTHKLRLGVMPMVTLWNPTNLPMVMDGNQVLRVNTPPISLRWRKYRNGSPTDFYDSLFFNLNYAMGGTGQGYGGSEGWKPHILSYNIGGDEPIVFEPGEVKVFCVDPNEYGTLVEDDDILVFHHELITPVNEYDPYGFFLTPNSASHGPWGNQAPEAYRFESNVLNSSLRTDWYSLGQCLVFNSSDFLSLQVITEDYSDMGDYSRGKHVSSHNEVRGAGFNFSLVYGGFQERDGKEFLRHYQMLSRFGYDSKSGPVTRSMGTFNTNLLALGFPDRNTLIDFSFGQAISCDNLIKRSNEPAPLIQGLLEFSMAYGCETGTNSNGGYGGGRRVALRPFLHSSPLNAPFIDSYEEDSLYNYGWNWQIGPISDVENSIIKADIDNPGNGFFGGGYTEESGSTRVVQTYLPAVPPISIATLSHAQLGGYSLAESAVMGDNPKSDRFGWNDDGQKNRMRTPRKTDFQQITATGQGGLAPHVMQAIGNSYAHPNLKADQFFTKWSRTFDATEGTENVPYVDHSYLANKALWDEYYFSSITPKPAGVQLFEGGGNRQATTVAEEFLYNDKKLPNRRMVPYKINLDREEFNQLASVYGEFEDGFADKIAAHQLISGPFNINSTNVESWKIFLSSLKDKTIARFDSGTSPTATTPDGTPILPGILPNEDPVPNGNISGPNQPIAQWLSGRELKESEIQELAEAIVKQIKLRGPFLSLSEFINRRLDSNNEEFAVKGALQSALDDRKVSINANFRMADRILDNETNGINFEFPKAAEGAIAYGSSTYVDQADLLRSFASQLTPRGDTFLIRTYGDSLSPSGKVIARAWCEAVVQRVPDYIDNSDDPHLDQSRLNETNRKFGRKFVITNFRWLDKDEI